MLELRIMDNKYEDTWLRFEHSLISLSKWEAKYRKPFLSTDEKTAEELIDYYRFMLSEEFDPDMVYQLRPEQMDQVGEYIALTPTASVVPEAKKKGPPQVVTSELIYCWMVNLNIPFEAQHWHLGRLMTLVRVIDYMNSPVEKRSEREIITDWKKLNEERLKKYNTTG